MNKDFEKTAESIMNSADGAAIKALSQSGDVQKLRQRLDGEALRSALERGDTDAVKALLSSAMSTAEGARIAGKLSELMK